MEALISRYLAVLKDQIQHQRSADSMSSNNKQTPKAVVQKTEPSTDQRSDSQEFQAPGAFQTSRVALELLNQGFEKGQEPVANRKAKLIIEEFGPP